MSRLRTSPPTERATHASAFDDYVAARGADLVRTAYLLTGDRGRAEDLVQTALAKVWPRWDRIVERAEPSPHAYVHKVLLTTYIAWWRRRWNAEVPTAAVPELGAPAAVDRVPHRRDLLSALASLPRGQRAVVVLRYFEDLTEAQTAEALGCSTGTVKSQCARALRTLRTSPHLVDGGEWP